MGLFCTPPPGPGSQPRAACHSRGQSSFQFHEECVWKRAFAMVGGGGGGSENMKKKKKRKDTTLYRFPGLFSTVPLPMPARDIKEDATGWGTCGAEEVQGLGERRAGWGGQSHLHFINICFHSASVRCTSPAQPGQDDGVVSLELHAEGTLCLVCGGVLNA